MGTEKRRAAPAGDTEGRVVRLPRRRLGRKRETLSITLCIFIGGPLAGLLYFLWESVLEGELLYFLWESVLKGGKGGPASFSELADMLWQILILWLCAGLIPCAIAGLAVKILALQRNLPGILGMTAVGAAVWWQYGRLLDVVFGHLGTSLSNIACLGACTFLILSVFLPKPQRAARDEDAAAGRDRPDNSSGSL